MNCEYCGSGIHSSEDLYIYDEGDEYGCYHLWCWEVIEDEVRSDS